MIALPLVAVAVAAAPVDSAASDVTVVGARLRKIRLAADTDKKGRITRCQVTVSSGDTAFDAQACLATRACADEGKAPGDPMTDCVDRRLIAFVAASRDDTSSREKSNAHD